MNALSTPSNSQSGNHRYRLLVVVTFLFLELDPTSATGDERLQERGAISTSESQAKSLTFSRDGTTVVSVHNDAVYWIDLAKMKVTHTTKCSFRSVFGMACSNSAGRVAVAGLPVDPKKNGIEVFERQTGESIFSTDAHKRYASSVEMSGDGKLLYSAGEDGIIYFWDVASKKAIREAIAHQPGEFCTIRLSLDETLLLSYGLDKRLIAWDAIIGSQIRATAIKSGGKNSIAVSLSPDRLFAAVHATWDESIQIIDLWTGKVVTSIPLERKDRTGCQFAFLNNTEVILRPLDLAGQITLINVFTNKSVVLCTRDEPIRQLAIDPIRNTLAFESNGRVRVFSCKRDCGRKLGESRINELLLGIASADLNRAATSFEELCAAADLTPNHLTKLLSPTTEEKLRELSHLVSELRAENPRARSAAADALARNGELVRPILQHAYRNTNDLDFRVQIEKIGSALQFSDSSSEFLAKTRMLVLLKNIPNLAGMKLLTSVSERNKNDPLSMTARMLAGY